MTSTLEIKLTNMQIFSYSVYFNFPCNLTRRRLGQFDMIFIT